MPVWQSAADILKMRGEAGKCRLLAVELLCFSWITFLNPFIPLVPIPSKKELCAYVEINNVPNKDILEKKCICCSDSFVLKKG